VVSNLASHAGDPGSLPGLGVFGFPCGCVGCGVKKQRVLPIGIEPHDHWTIRPTLYRLS
jgi:hypothetical protein